MNNLIINGIDHSKFDLEWAKRGGVVLTYFCGAKSIQNWTQFGIIGLDSEGIEAAQTHKLNDSKFELLVDQLKFNGGSIRMATPDECAEAGIEYIEPPARWLPIESAPKDGSRILIKKYGTVFVAGWGYVVDDIYGWVIVNDCYIEHSDNLLWMEPYSLFIGGKHGI